MNISPSLEFMGNAVNRLKYACVWNRNPWRTSKIKLEEERGKKEIKQHRGINGGVCTTAAVFSLRINVVKKRPGGLDES